MIRKFASLTLLAIIFSNAAFGWSFAVNLVKLKPKEDKKDWLHKVVYVSEAIAAGVSLGFDASTTLIAIRPSQTITGQSGVQTVVPGIVESNPLYATTQNGVDTFSETKMFLIKTGFAVVPVGTTWLLHHFRKDDTTTDVLSITAAGTVTGVFAWAGIHNLNAASANDAAVAAARAK